MTDLGSLGGNSSYAVALNDSGEVVGNSYTPGGWQHAFLYSNGTMADLGTLGGVDSEALGINNSGEVVGWAHGHAFLYSDGLMEDLNTLVPSSGWTLVSANAINAKGQIVATGGNSAGYNTHAFLLTPMLTNFSASDSRWASLPLGGSSAPIGGKGGKGCVLTSIAMGLTGIGIATDPGSLNTLLITNSGFSGSGNLALGTAVATFRNAAGIPGLKFTQVPSGERSSTAELTTLLSQGHDVLVSVEPGPTGWGHMVLVTGTQGSSYTIYDPAMGPASTGTRTLDYYTGGFELRGYVSDPPDLSEIDVSVVASGSGANLLVTDPDGSVTGIDRLGVRSRIDPQLRPFHGRDPWPWLQRADGRLAVRFDREPRIGRFWR